MLAIWWRRNRVVVVVRLGGGGGGGSTLPKHTPSIPTWPANMCALGKKRHICMVTRENWLAVADITIAEI